MSYTPEIKSSSVQKFSPFGVGISKTLLTPCRRVGLSRKRGNPTTPINIMKTPTESSKNLPNENSSKTPDYDCSVSNGRHSDSLSKNIGLEKKRFVDDKSIKSSSCKKVLAQNFSSEGSDVTSALTDKIGDLGVLTICRNTIDLQIDKEKEQDNLTMRNENSDQKKPQISQNYKKESMAPISLENTQNVEIEGQESSNNTLEKSSSNLQDKKEEKVVKSKKTTKSREKVPKKTVKGTTAYDSDDDFIPLDTKSSKKRKTSIAENTMKKISKSSSLVNCNVSLERLDSERSIKAKSFITSDNEYLSDNEFIVVKKKKYYFIEDDNDSINNSPKYVVSNADSNLHEDDEDMAFTSTPEQEKNEKKKLINMITDLEKSIVEKKRKLEDLKQASIYKKKHNIEELDTLTKRWKTGCESGLRCLLRQLQAHGPMDMAKLLEKLHIPHDVVAQLSLGDSSA